MSRRVAVVGGGLAGITAALRLADAGCAVTLLEARPKLGGLTHSFRRDGLDVDNGQHVFLRCCTAYRSLLDRLGVTDRTVLQPRLHVPVVRAGDGRRARLRRDPLPPPLHLLRSLATYDVLPVAGRVRAARAALALRGVDRDSGAADATTFGDWLARRHQSPAAVDALWDLIGVATLNARAADASLALAATVFQVGLLATSDAADIGWSMVPLQQLHGDGGAQALRRAGAQVHVRAKAHAVEPEGRGWVVRTAGGDLDADAVVVATDHVAAERLLPPGALELPPGWSQRLGSSPIVNVHVVLDRPVMTEPFVAALDSPVQWVFDRTAQSGLDRGQYLALSLSAADGLIDRTVTELRDLFLPELRRLLPAMRDAEVVDVFVTREPHATFRPAPGTRAMRPGARTALPGLVVAGAYTATGWPATMESAVRSGDNAAAAVLARHEQIDQVVTA
jgi:hydroxysqualene dehydroxylase